MTIEERLEKFLNREPQTSEALFVAPCAQLMGDVRLGRNSSVFYGSVLRGDIESIIIGEGTNIQDGVIIHLADDLPAIVGKDCTVGHGAIIHACTVGDRCLIGMNATVLDGAVIGEECLIAAGSVVTPRTIIPPGSMVVGSPAKVKRPLSPEERAGLKVWADKYIAVAKAHAARSHAPKIPRP
jgi:carbonic anhydrase/acetyltransferase-like protein (isoleucine patch superfamily)